MHARQDGDWHDAGWAEPGGWRRDDAGRDGFVGHRVGHESVQHDAWRHGLRDDGAAHGRRHDGGPGMMQNGSRSGMDALFGSRVTPVMNLSPEDVRGYLGLQLQRLNNKRLKIGDLKSDDGTITTDVVTVGNSLVQRLKIDRHTGVIQYEN